MEINAEIFDPNKKYTFDEASQEVGIYQRLDTSDKTYFFSNFGKMYSLTNWGLGWMLFPSYTDPISYSNSFFAKLKGKITITIQS